MCGLQWIINHLDIITLLFLILHWWETAMLALEILWDVKSFLEDRRHILCPWGNCLNLHSWKEAGLPAIYSALMLRFCSDISYQDHYVLYCDLTQCVGVFWQTNIHTSFQPQQRTLKNMMDFDSFKCGVIAFSYWLDLTGLGFVRVMISEQQMCLKCRVKKK